MKKLLIGLLALVSISVSADTFSMKSVVLTTHIIDSTECKNSYGAHFIPVTKLIVEKKWIDGIPQSMETVKRIVHEDIKFCAPGTSEYSNMASGACSAYCVKRAQQIERSIELTKDIINDLLSKY